MKVDVKVPNFAEGATKIQIRKWLVAEGATVKAGDSLAEAATDKIEIYIEAPVSGVLVSQLVGEEDSVLIDQVIAVISDEKVK